MGEYKKKAEEMRIKGEEIFMGLDMCKDTERLLQAEQSPPKAEEGQQSGPNGEGKKGGKKGGKSGKSPSGPSPKGGNKKKGKKLGKMSCEKLKKKCAEKKQEEEGEGE